LAEEVREEIAVQAFLRGIRDREIQQAVRLGRHKTTKDALAHALEVETAKRAASVSVTAWRETKIAPVSRSYTREKEDMKQRRRCYNCGEKGHICANCPKTTEARATVVSQTQCKRHKAYQLRQITTDDGSSEQDPWDPEVLARDQQKDIGIKAVYEWILRDSRPSWQEVASHPDATKVLWAQWKSLRLSNGVLVRLWESVDGQDTREQIVLPSSRVRAVLREAHDGTSGAHLGVTKTLYKVRERFYWPNMQRDVQQWINSCDVCARAKGPYAKTRGPLQTYNVGAPFERCAMDVIGPLPESQRGNRCALIVSDYFTKWVEVFPIPNQEAVTVADCLVNGWVARYGVPLELHSDQGRNFESAVVTELCARLGIRKTRTTPLHPQSDGMVERFNRTLEQHLQKVVSQNQRDWDEHIPLFLLAYRSSVHNSTQLSPARLVFGRELRLPCDLEFGTPPGSPESVTVYNQKLDARMEAIHQFARERLRVTSDRMKSRYDRVVTGTTFSVGDKVWLFNPRRRVGFSPKLQNNWEGPYVVISKINDVVFRIRNLSSRKLSVVHIDRLSRYISRNEDVSNLGGGSVT
jgi:Integrase zinc binding domain/Integrase core domain